MKLTFRWFGEEKDKITLEQIRQIPGVTGIVAALHTLPAGEPWPEDMIVSMKNKINAAGLDMECIESVNVHEDIKLGAKTRDMFIENYITSVKNLAKHGVKCICYNFMPVFDWTRTDLAHPMADGSTCLCYHGEQIEGKTPQQMFEEIDNNSNGYAMPGWETERMGEIKELFRRYDGMTAEDLWKNLEYFLNAVTPVCEETGVVLAIHPDDPPWDVFGLPRIIKNEESFERLLKICPSKANGITFCTGSLGANEQNDLPAMIRRFGDRIYFAHLRNIAVSGNRFNETAHLSSAGSLNMKEIVKALKDVDFDGFIRPDHGRMIWGETGRPGYGLFDRALGAAYINGLWEAL